MLAPRSIQPAEAIVFNPFAMKHFCHLFLLAVHCFLSSQASKPIPENFYENETQADSSNSEDLFTTAFSQHNFNDSTTIVGVVEVNEGIVEYDRLCADGSPLLKAGKPDDCSISRPCPMNFWCHIGSTKITTFCCPNARDDLGCGAQINVGSGGGQMTRWYFQNNTKKCYMFKYTGFGGNQNNFLTKSECEQTCKATTFSGEQQNLTESSSFPSECVETGGVEGIGNNTSTRFYFDPETEKCISFTFLGSGGTKNNFHSQEECFQKCLVNKKGVRRYPNVYPNQDLTMFPVQSNPCVLPVQKGYGSSQMQRWHFDAYSQTCQSFTFLGQGGNKNNFQTIQECQNACGQPLVLDSAVCSYTQSAGNGPYTIPRWSWNSQSGQCVQFFYKGYGGNYNRFPTQAMCLQTCRSIPVTPVPPIQTPIYVTPMIPPATYPGYFPSPAPTYAQPCKGSSSNPQSVQYCSASTNYMCPAGFYCHIGGTAATSVCCVATAQNACTLPQDAGVGTLALTRFYFNFAMGRCQSFIYKGLQGNQNNFLTYDKCTQACALNPCSRGTPYALNGQNIQCSAIQQGICPKNYYCHIGLDISTTVCCPKTGEDPCNLPIQKGRGQGQLQRWTYNAQTKMCETVMYTGIGGNENNYLSEADCLGTCPSVFNNPCGHGTPGQASASQNFLYCSVMSSQCPPGFFCHYGSGADSTLCCPVSGSNRCQLPLATGTGNAVLTRYYFDFASSLCKAFTYTGLRGNENNFLSLAECRKICPEFDNPCPTGAPSTSISTGQVQFCSQTNPSCPNNYWCHKGYSRQTTVCCPNASNPCTQQKVIGFGQSQLPRWYYDSFRRTCSEFAYSGKGGNQNNFVTKAECFAACPVLDNPCASGMPALTPQGNPVLCSTSNVNACSAGYFCHLGDNAATTLCCPGAGDPCSMSLSKGVGTSVLNRWYYNRDTQTCLSFTYTGKGGNQNNFLSLAECRLKCREYQNPCSTGQPHIGRDGLITHCGATMSSSCPPTFYCHQGETFDSSVCCPGAGNPCELPLAPGNGNAALPRYYYDSRTQTCQQFQYSGMGGNQNSFMSLSQCEKRCPVFKNPCSGEPIRNAMNQIIPCSVSNMAVCPSPTHWCHVGADEKTTLCCPVVGNLPVCSQSLNAGTGTAALPRYYYNALTKQCLPFTYSGVGGLSPENFVGNQNNFLSLQDCQAQCPVFVNPCVMGDPATSATGEYVLCSSSNLNGCPANYWCHLGSSDQNSVCCPGAENPCTLPVSAGNGNAAIPRWYFDISTRRCTQFSYSGLGGNQNNFVSLQYCQVTCPEFKNPCSYGDPAQAPTSTGVLFCSSVARSCPSGYWCHLGASDETTVCCPGATSPCLQPLMPGTGSSRLPRYYYNQNARQCLPFTYTGIGGNQNNYMTQQECMQACPVLENVCGSTANPPQVVQCSAESRLCAAGYWCHVGFSQDTTVCCPGDADPCVLPMNIGTRVSASTLPRWYFDKDTQTCKQFQYSGEGGNQNNFLTREDCGHKCQEFLNPCLSGPPYQDVSGLVKYCNADRPTDCPSQFYCHRGSTQQTTVCCPGAGDPCTLPVAIGSGPASLPRYYFNTATRRCQSFTYRGMKGNQNNFFTERDCQLACPEFINNPCSPGNPLSTILGQIQYCSSQNPNICPPNFYCHVGLSQDTTVCCPSSGDPCNLPVEVGFGSASVQRYSFNQILRRCETFIYTGTGGNANNFQTLVECRSKCSEFSNPCGNGLPYKSPGGQNLYCNSNSACPLSYYCHYGQDTSTTLCCPSSSGSTCMLPVVIGTGQTQLTRYYYNSVLKTCVSFVYSGLGGNENNFRTESECQASCQPVTNPCGGSKAPYQSAQGQNLICGGTSGQQNQCPLGYYCHYGSDVWNTVCCPTEGNRCELPLSVGVGGSLLQRWYFNPTIHTCQLFMYKGSGGNANNFLSQNTCQAECAAQVMGKGPCPQGEPLMGPSGAQKTCQVNYPQPSPQGCPVTYVCNLQASGTQALCCPDPRHFCVRPRDSGGLNCPTSTKVTRFGYNPTTDTCVPFSYSGCGGNLNNFYTLESCTTVCCNRGFNRLYLLVQAQRQKLRKMVKSKTFDRLHDSSIFDTDEAFLTNLTETFNETQAGFDAISEFEMLFNLTAEEQFSLLEHYLNVTSEIKPDAQDESQKAKSNPKERVSSKLLWPWIPDFVKFFW